jgi:hypothetical protein
VQGADVELHQVVSCECLANHNITHSLEYETNVFGTCCACHMRVDHLVGVAIEVDKLVLQVRNTLVVIAATYTFAIQQQQQQ